MEITLGYGIDSILFGLTEQQVIAALGKPDKTFFTDEENKRLQFNELLLELSFESENAHRLGWIEVHNKNVTIFGHQLIGKAMAEVVSILRAELDTEPTIDDYGSFISVTFEKEWLELQFSFNKLTNINFGVLYGKNDEPEWPAT
ncbi:hypothetical protein [Pseudoalteromonas maricaloris]|uniref:hypothetical protein n=1 Tax=Pseudoalteromonas maricaloris TaxID=184924 RepID=UPI000299F16D|nr:hypothetical protein [Pseudoalteromonas flavipulchra]